MMHKEKAALDGVQISGSEKLGKEEPTIKGKLKSEGKNTPKQKQIIGSNSTENRDRKKPPPEDE